MSIQLEAAKRAARILNAIDASYAILLPDGESISKGINLVDEGAEQPKKRRQVRDFAHTGYGGQIRGLGVGQTTKMPINGFQGADIARFHSAIIATCVNKWGRGSCISHLDREAGHIEVLRIK